jgi:transcriptional regulator with XRE-family HTH domain
MDFFSQLQQRRAQLGKTHRALSEATGIASPNVSNIITGKKDVKASTLQAMADALDARWMLIPKHLLPEVERLLSGKAIGPDQVPSTVERLFGGATDE